MAVLPQVFAAADFSRPEQRAFLLIGKGLAMRKTPQTCMSARLATVEHVELVLSNQEGNLAAVELAEHVYASPRCVTILLEFEDATQDTGCEVP